MCLIKCRDWRTVRLCRAPCCVRVEFVPPPGRFSCKDAAAPASGGPQPVLTPQQTWMQTDAREHFIFSLYSFSYYTKKWTDSNFAHILSRAAGRLEHLPFILFPEVVFFREVNKVNHRFGCQKQVFVQHFDLWRIHESKGFKLLETRQIKMSLMTFRQQNQDESQHYFTKVINGSLTGQLRKSNSWILTQVQSLTSLSFQSW